MALIDLKNKLVQAKIVYYGPGRGGKTTNLEFINNKFRKRLQTDMISIKTQGDRTLFFDFLPFDMGSIMGFQIKIQLYTVPGQVKYNATRQLVLKGVDGLVFVADSSVDRREQNTYSLNNLAENGQPVQDLEAMEQELNGRVKAPSFPASAKNGKNVAATMKKIIAMTVSSLEENLT